MTNVEGRQKAALFFRSTFMIPISTALYQPGCFPSTFVIPVANSINAGRLRLNRSLGDDRIASSTPGSEPSERVSGPTNMLFRLALATRDCPLGLGGWSAYSLAGGSLPCAAPCGDCSPLVLAEIGLALCPAGSCFPSTFVIPCSTFDISPPPACLPVSPSSCLPVSLSPCLPLIGPLLLGT